MGPFIALQFDMFVQPDLTVEQVALVEDQGQAGPLGHSRVIRVRDAWGGSHPSPNTYDR